MLNDTVTNALLILTLIAASIATVTDLKYGKIYNKMIIILGLIGAPLVTTLYGFLNKDLLLQFIINFSITIMLSLLFYAFKIWAAGDAKLMALLVFLLPYSYYYSYEGMYFPTIYIFIVIFSLAFLYVVMESIFLSIQDCKMLKARIKSIHISLSGTVNFLIILLSGMLLSGLFANCFSVMFGDVFLKNAYAFSILNFFALTLFYSIVKSKYMCYALIVEIILNTLFVLATKANLANIIPIRLSSVFMAITIIFIRFIADTYNYRVIMASETRAGMVLSYASAILLSSFKKGPTILTDETTKTRILEEQAQAIRNWAATRKDEPSISIVRLMPFSIFILVGLLLYLLKGMIQ